MKRKNKEEGKTLESAMERKEQDHSIRWPTISQY